MWGNGEIHWSSCSECDRERAESRRKEDAEIEEQERLRTINRRLRRSGIPKRFESKTFEEMDSKGQNQKNILKAVSNYLKAFLSGSRTSLILCGRPGTGKTHIGCCLVRAAIEKDKGAGIISISALMRNIKSTYSPDSEKTEEEAYDFYGKMPLLVIDEVGVQFGSETEKLIFYEVINARYNNELPTVLISNLTQDELCAFIGERAFDRFKEDGGAVLAFDWESHRR